MEGIENIVYHQRKAYPYVRFYLFEYFYSNGYCNTFFSKQQTALKQLIYDDFKATKRCRLSIAKEPLFPDQLAFAMPKSSSLTEIYNIEY